MTTFSLWKKPFQSIDLKGENAGKQHFFPFSHHIFFSFKEKLYNSSVNTVHTMQALRTGGQCFDFRTRTIYPFRGLMMVIATGFIPLSPFIFIVHFVDDEDRNGVKHHTINQSITMKLFANFNKAKKFVILFLYLPTILKNSLCLFLQDFVHLNVTQLLID